ncbi:MAG: DNA primase [Oscillospiraceae bacterium]|nr:DNA primase [Oscillospiraceae bacterium]
MAFPESFLEELVSRNDIVDVVGSYVQLTKRSGANYFGLCPFHNERTPSFSVNPSEQFYYCFGCGKGGGVINFIMEIENLPYPDAVRSLAQRAGMQVPEESYDPNAKQRGRLLEANKEAARWFYAQLSEPGGKRCTDYMQERRISPQTARRFGLGYAPDTKGSFLRHMRDQGFQDYELLNADLIRKGDYGYYDTFRDRLMFPIIDVRGDVIGFSGRALGDAGAKYLNSRDTPVFNKGRHLFALNLAKKSKAGYILLSEGNIDIVSLHQAGFDSAVASLGTSLTPEQARLLSRYTNEVIIAYDNDGAGIKASQRAIGILERLDLKVRVLRMEGAKDPDEYIRTRGAEAFRNLLKASEDQIDYRLNSVTAKYDLTQDSQKLAYLQEASALLASLPNPVARQVYAIRVAGQAGVGQDAVIDEVERQRKRLLGRARRNEERETFRPERSAQPEAKNLRYLNPESAVAEEGLIRLLFRYPEYRSEPELPKPEEFSSEALAKIYALLLRRLEAGGELSVNSFSSELSQDEMNLTVSLLQKPELASGSADALKDYIRKIREQKERAAQSGVPDLNALGRKLRERKGYHQ